MTLLQFNDINLLPDKENVNILRTISALGIANKPIYVDIIPDINAITGECFLNVFNKVDTAKGEAVFGWKFAEYSFMIEAEFHAVWKTSHGNLVDITLSDDPKAKKILFVIDHTRAFDGKRTDNFRFNTTNNALIDDIIEIERAKFVLTDNAKEVDATGRVIFNEDQSIKWEQLNLVSLTLDEMCRCNKTVQSKCFCNSSLSYEQCHRQNIKEFLATIY